MPRLDLNAQNPKLVQDLLTALIEYYAVTEHPSLVRLSLLRTPYDRIYIFRRYLTNVCITIDAIINTQQCPQRHMMEGSAWSLVQTFCRLLAWWSTYPALALVFIITPAFTMLVLSRDYLSGNAAIILMMAQEYTGYKCGRDTIHARGLIGYFLVTYFRLFLRL